MEEPTEIKSALLPEEKHISGICCFTVKSFQSLLLAEGKSFSQPGVCERANPPSLLGINLNITAWHWSQEKGFLCTLVTGKGGMRQGLEIQGVAVAPRLLS